MRAIPAVFMRGGTSKGVFFHERHLPPAGSERDEILLSVIGSPDPYGRQLDGMGGGLSSLSKAALIRSSARDDADVDYTFAQIAIDAARVDYSANCGNLSAAVGPFAIEEGLLGWYAGPGQVCVRIFNVNTCKIIHARFDLAGAGAPRERGACVIDGVAGAGAPIVLDFLDPAGAATGRLLPTGSACDVLDLGDGGRIEASLVDAANPMAFVRADALGLEGDESPDEIEARPEVMARLETIRRAAAHAMGLAPAGGDASEVQSVNPRVGLLAPPRTFRALDGRTHQANTFDISIRMLSLGRVHRAVTATGAMCLAVAQRIGGSIAHALCLSAESDLRVGHPSGLIEVGARTRGNEVVSTRLVRTARRLMHGEVLLAR